MRKYNPTRARQLLLSNTSFLLWILFTLSSVSVNSFAIDLELIRTRYLGTQDGAPLFKFDIVSPKVKDDSIVLIRQSGSALLSGRFRAAVNPDEFVVLKSKFLSGKILNSLIPNQSYQVFLRKTSLQMDGEESRADSGGSAIEEKPRRTLASYSMVSNRKRRPIFFDLAVGGADPLGGFYGALIGYSMSDFMAFNVGGGYSKESGTSLTSGSVGLRFFVPGWSFTPYFGGTYSYVFSGAALGSAQQKVQETVPPPVASASNSLTVSAANTADELAPNSKVHYLSVPFGLEWQLRGGLRLSAGSSYSKPLKSSEGANGFQGITGVGIRLGFSIMPGR